MPSLKICPAKAYLTRDTQATSAMDPFVKLILGKQKHQTKTIAYGGMKVEWNETFLINSQGDNILKVQVYDEDNVVNDLVGSAQIDLTPYFGSRSLVQKYVSIKYNKIPAGKVLLVISPAQGRIQSQNRINSKQFTLFKPDDIIKHTINIFTQKDDKKQYRRSQNIQNMNNNNNMIRLQNAPKQSNYKTTHAVDNWRINRIDRPVSSQNNSISIKYENHGDDEKPYYKPPAGDKFYQSYLYTPSKYENAQKFRHTEYMKEPALNFLGTPQQNINNGSANKSKYSSGSKSGSRKGLSLSQRPISNKIGGGSK